MCHVRRDDFSDMQKTGAIKLSQLTQLITETLRREPRLNDVWVLAELSDVRGSKGTHWYMELLEKDEAGATVARLRANMWAGVAQTLNRRLYEATGTWFKSGIKVMIRGQVTHHSSHGLSFNIADVEPSYTLGEMERRRQEILRALAAEGLTDRNKKVAVPIAPQRIAVISAEGAAGYGDFVNQLASTPEGFVFYPVLFPARMQGETTARSVMAALDRIEAHAGMWDVVVIIRGGGSTSDLNGFDDLALARRIALCPLPVAVGIGHERDRTVLDEIACIRCKTPTAVAAWLTDALREAAARAAELGSAAARQATDLLHAATRRLDALGSAIPLAATRRLNEASRQLSATAMQLPSLARQATSRATVRIGDIAARLRQLTAIRLDRERTRLTMLTQQTGDSAMRRIETERLRLETTERVVGVLDPRATLRRGYTITRFNGHALRDASRLNPGDIVETVLADGAFSAIVTDKT